MEVTKSRNRSSMIWNHYTPLNRTVAECNICKKVLSYKTSISNLKRHSQGRHPKIKIAKSGKLPKHVRIKKMSEKKSRKCSIIWDYFTPLGQGVAQCMICNNKFSHKTTISNLKKHLETKHPTVKIAELTNNPRKSLQNLSDGKLENRPPPLRVPSPLSSDNESLITESISSNVNPSSSSTPAVSQPTAQQPSFKKIKLSQEVPYTEGYLDESSYELLKPSHKKSPPRITNPRQNPRSNPRPNPRVYNEQEAHICSSCPCIAAQESEYDKIGKAWATELKKMTSEQQIFAKRAIAEIIFEGQLGSLNRNSVQVRRQVHQTTHAVDDPLVEEEFVYQKTDPELQII